MYFIRGSLPWQGLPAKTKEEKYEQIKIKKAVTSIEDLTSAKGIRRNSNIFLTTLGNSNSKKSELVQALEFTKFDLNTIRGTEL